MSGAHFNPVVSIADALLGRRGRTGLPFPVLGAYVGAQLLGAIGGAVLANLMFAVPTVLSTTERATPATFLSEIVATTGLVLLIAGLACDTMRVASIVWSPGESFYNFTQILPNAPWGDLSCPPNVDTCTDGKNLPATFLHVMSHFPPSTANGVPGNMNTMQTAALECLTAVEVWFSEQLAYFAQQLAGITESDGTSVLDNTVLLSIKDISEGVTHGYRDVPAVILGGQGLFNRGHFNLRNQKTFGDLYATIGQSLGFDDITSFGDEQYFTGTVDEIRV